MVVTSCFQSCLWSCLLLLLTGSVDKLCAWFISLLCLGQLLDSVISSMTGPLWLGRALPSECSEDSWWLFPVGWPCSLCFPGLLQHGGSKQQGRGMVMVKQTNKLVKPKQKTFNVGQENTKIFVYKKTSELDWKSKRLMHQLKTEFSSISWLYQWDCSAVWKRKLRFKLSIWYF